MTNPEKRILNAGCGRDMSIGTDFIDAYTYTTMVKKCDMDKDRFPYDDETFDEIVAFSVFEHLTNHAHFLKECKRVLKDEGRLTITTDNASCLSFTFLYEHGRIIEEWRKDDMHFGLFTIGHLENFARRFGFTMQDARYMRGEPPRNILKRIAQEIMWRLNQKITAYSIKVEMVK